MAEWRTALAPRIARSYWHLGENGTGKGVSVDVLEKALAHIPENIDLISDQ